MFKLKSTFLSSVAPLFAPDDEGKTEAQKARDAIKVESFKKDDEKKEPEKKEEKSEDGSENSEDANDEGKEENEDDVDETSDEEKKEEVEASPEDLKKEKAKLEKTIERLQKRVGKTTAEKNQIAQQLADATASLNAKVEEGKGLSEEEVERRSNAKAEEKSLEREFNKAVSTLNKSATKVDKDFPAKIKELTEDVAPIPGQMIGILEDLDNGGAVLAHLASNPDEFEEIYELSLARMATRLSKLSDKLEEAGKEKPKKISKTPAPLNTIKGGEKSPSILPANPTKNMAEYVQQRNIQVAERRKAKYGA